MRESEIHFEVGKLVDEIRKLRGDITRRLYTYGKVWRVKWPSAVSSEINDRLTAIESRLKELEALDPELFHRALDGRAVTP